MALDLGFLETAASASSGSPLMVPLDSILEDTDQPRTKFNEASLAELANDIKTRGILQPIVVLPPVNGQYKILYGARRLRAGLLAGLKEFPVFVASDPRQFDSCAQVAENRQRESLTPLEEAGFIKKRLAAGEKAKEIGKNMGVSPTVVTMLCALIEPPKFLLELHESGRCRSADYLYRLRKLYEQSPDVVIEKVAAAEEIGKGFIETLTADVNASPNIFNKTGNKKKTEPGGEGDKVKYNVICLKYRKRTAQLVLNRRATAVGLGWICYDDDKFVDEVLLSDCVIESLQQR